MSEFKPSVIIHLDIDYYKKVQYISGMMGLTPSEFVSKLFYEGPFLNQIDATYSVFLRNQSLLQKAKLSQEEEEKFMKDYVELTKDRQTKK